jgi:general stress protein 26
MQIWHDDGRGTSTVKCRSFARAERSNAMTEEETVDRAWQLIGDISICMLVTRSGNDLRARPMASTADRDENAIYCLTDVRKEKDDEIEADPSVCLAFADTKGQKYVSVTGVGTVSDDREKIAELWSPAAKAWWSSPDDPNIRVLRVTPETAEYWDSPGSIAAYASMAIAAVTGSRPSVGDHRKVTI